MNKENKTSDNQQNGNDFIADVKPMTEIEYLEYMSKKAKTVRVITYPDESKGELNRGVVVLL